MRHHDPAGTSSRLDLDEGVTLIELMIATAILSVVLLAIGAIFLGTLNAQRTVSAVTQSATAAQGAASAIASAVRNSSDLRLTTTSGNQLLVTRTAGQGSTLTWSCKAWYYTPSDGTIRTTSAADGTRITAPTSAQLATWTVAVSGVAPSSGSTIFTTVAGGVSFAFTAQVAGKPPVTIQTTAIKRTGVAEAGTCY